MAVFLVKKIEENADAAKVTSNIFETFDEAKHPLTVKIFLFATPTLPQSKIVDVKSVPVVEAVEKLIKNIFKIGQLAPESLIMGVVCSIRLITFFV